MSLLAATQIPKPADEQAFERASVVLWRGILNDPAVQRNGRRGQRQNGVDLFGIRDGNADWQVGIQCKLKSDGHFLSEDEVRDEVSKAQTFKPPLKEYFIITTAPDDGRCCRTLIFEDSQRESMRLDGRHEQADTHPLPHDELVKLHCFTSLPRVAADLAGQGDDLARAA